MNFRTDMYKNWTANYPPIKLNELLHSPKGGSCLSSSDHAAWAFQCPGEAGVWQESADGARARRRTLASCKYPKKCTHEEKARGPSGACVTSLNYPDDHCRVQPPHPCESLFAPYTRARGKRTGALGVDRYSPSYVGALVRAAFPLLEFIAHTEHSVGYYYSKVWGTLLRV